MEAVHCFFSIFGSRGQIMSDVELQVATRVRCGINPLPKSVWQHSKHARSVQTVPFKYQFRGTRGQSPGTTDESTCDL